MFSTRRSTLENPGKEEAREGPQPGGKGLGNKTGESSARKRGATREESDSTLEDRGKQISTGRWVKKTAVRLSLIEEDGNGRVETKIQIKGKGRLRLLKPSRGKKKGIKERRRSRNLFRGKKDKTPQKRSRTKREDKGEGSVYGRRRRDVLLWENKKGFFP